MNVGESYFRNEIDNVRRKIRDAEYERQNLQRMVNSKKEDLNRSRMQIDQRRREVDTIFENFKIQCQLIERENSNKQINNDNNTEENIRRIL